MKTDRLNLFLVVYACEPHQGGEHEVGWRVANELAGNFNLIVVTRKSNKKLIEENNINNIDFRYLENDMFIKFKPKGKFSYMYYLFWQLSVYLYLQNKVKKEDMVHYLTFGNIHLPHFLFFLKSKLILGPMGGGSIINPNLMRNSSVKVKLKSLVYKFINLSVLINPIYYLLFFKSSKMILRTEETLNIVPRFFHYKCSVFLETGIDTSKVNVIEKDRKLRKIITTARIVDSKNIDQVIDVFRHLQLMYSETLELSIVGDGPLKSVLEKKYTNVEGLSFLGKVEHEKIETLLQEADLFIFCSIKEGGSHSLFEAAINNCPIACYNISGMKEFPKDDSAIKINPIEDINENTKMLAKKISKSFQDEIINEICNNASNDLKENYNWNNITKKFIAIYEDILKDTK